MKPVHVFLLLLLLQCAFNRQPDLIEKSTVAYNSDDFIRNKYYFLDNIYRRGYIRKYAPAHYTYSPPPPVTELSLWRSNDGFYNDLKDIKMVTIDSSGDQYRFERLERDRHYHLNESEGWIRIVDSVYIQPAQMLAVYMRTGESGNPEFRQLQKGMVETEQVVDSSSGTMSIDSSWSLWLLRTREANESSAETDSTRFHLMWRNVYSQFGPYRFTTIRDVRVKINYWGNPDDEDGNSIRNIETTPSGILISDLMGITSNGVPCTDDTTIYNFNFNDLILPPFDTSERALEPFNNPALGAWRDSVIYQSSMEDIKRLRSAGMYKAKFELWCSITYTEDQEE